MTEMKTAVTISLDEPKIYNWELRGKTVYVRCSPVSRINIITDGLSCSGAAFKADTDEDFVTNAKWILHGDEQCIKAECIDRAGKRTVSSVIYLNN